MSDNDTKPPLLEEITEQIARALAAEKAAAREVDRLRREADDMEKRRQELRRAASQLRGEYDRYVEALARKKALEAMEGSGNAAAVQPDA